MELKIGSQIAHRAYGKGVVVEEHVSSVKIYFHDLDKSKLIERDDDETEVLAEGEGAGTVMSIEEVEDVIWRVLTKYGGATETVTLADKWKGGMLSMVPKDPSLQGKEIPIDGFWHKIVMLRDRLRVLEQQINSNKVLDDGDKVNLQQYITRIYGSLTTFNVLFKYKEQQFKGTGKG